MLPSAGSILGFFPTIADQPLSFPHCCVLLVAASSGRLSERSKQPVLGANGVYLALKIHASCDEASAAVPAERILLCNYFTHQKNKDLSPSASYVLAKALGTAFPVRLKLMFASPPVPMTDQYTLIDFSHQNIYFSNRTPSSQTNEGLHKKSSASVWQQTENRNIFLYSKTKFLWLNRAKNISPLHFSQTRDISECRKQLFPAANGPNKRSTRLVLSRNRCASNAVIYSKLRLQTDLLLTYLYRWESCRGCANPTAGSRTPDRPMPAGCVMACRGHRHGAAGHPPGLSLKDRQIAFRHQHLTWCLVHPELREGSWRDVGSSVCGLASWVVLPGVLCWVPAAGHRGAAGGEGVMVNRSLRAGTNEVMSFGGSPKGKAGQGESLSCPQAFSSAL